MVCRASLITTATSKNTWSIVQGSGLRGPSHLGMVGLFGPVGAVAAGRE
jgi:hypothetical protein